MTPELNGSILKGITRTSIIELLGTWGIPVTEKKISVHELYRAYEEGHVEEIFGTGTAAVISPVGQLNWLGRNMMVNNGEIGELSQKLYDTITGIQTGKLEDPLEWTVEIK